jgi:glycogen operon protein
MTDADWDTGFAKSLGVFLNGHAIPDRDRHGQQISDDSFYVLFNSWEQPIDFALPAAVWGRSWTTVLDTSASRPTPSGVAYQAASTVSLLGRHFLLLKRE